MAVEVNHATDLFKSSRATKLPRRATSLPPRMGPTIGGCSESRPVRSEKLLSDEPEHPPAGLRGNATVHPDARLRRHPDLLMRICNQHTHFAAVRASANGSAP